MFQKGDVITLIDGTRGTVEGIVRTEVSNIYRVKLESSGAEAYFEEDKLVLFRRKPASSFLAMVRAFVDALFQNSKPVL